MKKALIAGLIIIVLAAGGWMILKNNDADNDKDGTTTPVPSSQSTTPTTSNQPVTEATVNIKNMMFTPSQVTVDNGGTVTWTNNDTVAHNVIVDNGDGPSSDLIQPGSSYSYKFTKAGSYQYHCSVHPSMRGTIVVR